MAGRPTSKRHLLCLNPITASLPVTEDLWRSLISGWANAYQEDEKLEEAGITPVYSPFSQQSYRQLFGGFVGNLSVVDVLMNCGYLGTRRLLGIESSMADGAVFER